MSKFGVALAAFLFVAVLVDNFLYEPVLSQDLPPNLECEYRHNIVGGTQYYCFDE